MRSRSFLPAIFVASLATSALSQAPAPSLLPPDERYKADLLLVIAHPDDDVMIGGYLARLSLDEHKRIAVVYTTNGDGGGNAVGNEAGLALGQERQIEARRALQSLGIENVWFLGGNDTPGQNPLRSLDRWNHGKMLDEVVRLVRITRPDVVVTWLPDQVAGENHGDHQAAGILATEAFDAAGDPAAFSEQISAPRDRNGLMNLTEGLKPWQPRKLYFFTDAFEVFTPYWHDPAEPPAFRKNIGDGTGPVYNPKDISAARLLSYAELEAVQQTFYATQEGYLGADALKKRNLSTFEFPIRLILGRSAVGGSITGDVFGGIAGPIPFSPPPRLNAEEKLGISLEIGDPWRFYRLWWRAHGIERLEALLPEPELAAAFGEHIGVPLLLCNRTASDAEVALSADLPTGWLKDARPNRYPVRAGECYPLTENLVAPAAGKPEWQKLEWTAEAGGMKVGSVRVRAFFGQSGGLPQ